jgi:predicted nucleic acid-binding protein
VTIPLADTSLFIAVEQGRALRAPPPPRYHVSVVTVGEWIAATAIAHGLPVATQDDDYDEVPGLQVVKL